MLNFSTDKLPHIVYNWPINLLLLTPVTASDALWYRARYKQPWLQ